MVVLWCVTILFGIVHSQQYGPPGYTPGIPISAPVLSEIIKSTGYDSPSSYDAPARGRALSGHSYEPPVSSGYSSGLPPASSYGSPAQSPQSSYGSPAQSLQSSYGSPAQSPQSSYGSPAQSPQSSYGAPPASFSYAPPSADKSRFKIIPASEFKIPEQHSNLIRYIVLKEFQIGENGSVTPLQMGLGRNNGNGSPEMEIMKVQLPNSAEAGSGEVSGGYADGPSSGGYSDGQGGRDANEDDEYDDEDYDDEEEDQVNNNSIEDEVVPAKGMDLTSSTGSQSANPNPTQAFMFSDPKSNSMEAQSRQGSGGIRNTLKNSQNAIRNRLPGRRNRNKNRQRNRNRNRVAAKTAKASAAAPTNATVTSSTSSSTATASAGPQVDELQSALQVLSRYFSSQAQTMRQQMGQSASSSGGRAMAESPSNAFSAPTQTGAVPSGGYASSSGASSNASAGAESGGYQGSGQPESGATDAKVIDPDTPPTQATQAAIPIPASSYGPSPGTGFATGGGGANNLADAITRPIQLAAGFKSGVITGGANLLSAGIKSVAAATSAVTRGFANVGASVGGGSGSGGYSAPAAAPGSAYGVPSSGSSGISPLRQIVGLKGQAVRTVAKTGRAALGIAGTKGQLVVNQFGTAANILTKGVSHLLTNNHEAFQDVVKHIQTIFQANERLRQQDWQ